LVGLLAAQLVLGSVQMLVQELLLAARLVQTLVQELLSLLSSSLLLAARLVLGSAQELLLVAQLVLVSAQMLLAAELVMESVMALHRLCRRQDHLWQHLLCKNCPSPLKS
jgi:hypothetical protein